MENLFFNNWESLLRIFIMTVLAYAAIIILLRSSGKRTLSKMNAFDFIVTIALGSTLATVSLNKNIALSDGVLAFILLIGLQYLISFAAVRSALFSRLIKSTPSLLLYKGQMLTQVMKKERITPGEIYAILREKGLSSLEEAGAVILETDGSLTVVKEADMQNKIFSNLEKPERIN